MSNTVPLTPLLNQNNVEFVRAQIESKKCCKPYYATADYAPDTITDMDHFPYTRYFRGVSYFPDPIVAEREAGWRQRHPDCYKAPCVQPPMPAKYCWQGPCNLTLPCKPEFYTRFSEQNNYNKLIDASCIVQYR